jgi:hypothetical protein
VSVKEVKGKGWRAVAFETIAWKLGDFHRVRAFEVGALSL